MAPWAGAGRCAAASMEHSSPDDDAGGGRRRLDGESMADNLGRLLCHPDRSIRYRTALDAVDLQLRRDPLTGKYAAEKRIKSSDAGALYRNGDSVLTLAAPYVTGEGSVEDIRRHWAPIFKWLGRRHSWCPACACCSPWALSSGQARACASPSLAGLAAWQLRRDICARDCA